MAAKAAAAAMEAAAVAEERMAAEGVVARARVFAALAMAKEGADMVVAVEMARESSEKAAASEPTKVEAEAMVVVTAQEMRVAVEPVEVVELVATTVVTVRVSKRVESRLALPQSRDH